MQKRLNSRNVNKVLMVGGSTMSKVLIESILCASTDFILAGAMDDVPGLADAVDSLRPDMVLIDLCVSDGLGRAALDALCVYRTVRKVIVSPEPLAGPACQALLDAGASSVFHKKAVTQDHDAFRDHLRALMQDAGAPVTAGFDMAVDPPAAQGGTLVPLVPVDAARPDAAPVPAIALDGAPSLSTLPDHEELRLLALGALQIANDARDRRLDLVVRHLCNVTGYPMAAVTLIDASVQWIKAGAGIERAATPRLGAICDHTIRSPGPLVVADTFDHPVFSEFACVRQAPFIRSYVGVPLFVECGVAIGALCLLDTNPRTCIQRELPILTDMAALVVEMLDKPWERMAA